MSMLNMSHPSILFGINTSIHSSFDVNAGINRKSLETFVHLEAMFYPSLAKHCDTDTRIII